MKKKELRRRVVFRLVRAQAGATPELLNLCVESVTRSEKQREKRFIQMQGRTRAAAAAERRRRRENPPEGVFRHLVLSKDGN